MAEITDEAVAAIRAKLARVSRFIAGTNVGEQLVDVEAGRTVTDLLDEVASLLPEVDCVEERRVGLLQVDDVIPGVGRVSMAPVVENGRVVIEIDRTVRLSYAVTAEVCVAPSEPTMVEVGR